MFSSRFLLLAAGLATGSLFAQSDAPLAFPAASQPATISQRVGLTDIEITYSRPAMRGREIFGALVPYGEVWRTGANNATKITFSTDVTLNGSAVPAGTYELHTIPTPGDWTVIIHRDMGQWGSYAYDPENDIARFTASPESLRTPVQTLTLSIDDIKKESATLGIAWAGTRVPVEIEVDVAGQLVPQIEAAMAADGGNKPYFQAAMYYYENDLDLEKATAWMDAAVAGNPGQMWMIYRQGLILAKKGDKAAALAAARQSIELAQNAPSPSLRDEYIRLNEALIASLR